MDVQLKWRAVKVKARINRSKARHTSIEVSERKTSNNVKARVDAIYQLEKPNKQQTHETRNKQQHITVNIHQLLQINNHATHNNNNHKREQTTTHGIHKV